MAPFPSRDPSRTAILGASSTGWTSSSSPSSKAGAQDTSASSAMSASTVVSSSSGPNGAPKSMPEHRANLGSLRSHGLVSNSVFKSSGSPTSAHSSSSPYSAGLNGSPSRSAASQRFGFGLGISAGNTTSPSKSRTAPSSVTKKSPSNRGVNGSTSDVENEHESQAAIIYRATDNASLKSQGIQRLQNASYVTHSPFRQSENDGDRSLEHPPELPNNAWARSAAAAITSPSRASKTDARPSTPERTPLRTATAHAAGDVDLGTPTSQETPRSVPRHLNTTSRTDSPGGRGLLVYNRLQGPRTMSNGGSASGSPTDATARQERRKTVTFDEVLDVQEFDRESSFGHESVQSLGSESNLQPEAGNTHDGSDADGETSPDMWLSQGRDRGADKVVERLMVVNGSPESAHSEFSTPELSNQIDEHLDGLNAHEGDSSSADSQDEPQSPRAHEVSFERTSDKKFNTAPANQSQYQDSVYTDPEADVSGGHLSAYAASHRVDNLVDELLGDELLGSKKSASQPEVAQDAPVKRQQSEAAPSTTSKPLPSAPGKSSSPTLGDLQLNLPEWSPIMSMPGLSPTEEIKMQRASRVAMMSGAQSTSPREEVKPLSSSSSGRPHISRDAIRERVAKEKQMQQEQEKAAEDAKPLVEEAATAGSVVAEPVEPVKVMAAPKLVRQPTDEAQRSPLERLTAEVAAEQAQAVEANNASASASDMSSASALRQDAWFANSSLEESSTSEAAARNAASSSSALALTPAQQAEQIIARRRSKNGRAGPSAPTGRGLHSRRSLSDGNISRSNSDRESQREMPMSAEAEDARIAADVREEELLHQKHLLDSSLKLAVEPGFETHLEREISRIYRQGNEKYHVHDRGTFASSSHDDQVSHSAQAGDVANGKRAWRKLRRPSDMNEYAKEMREIRAKENPKKATGKVFVVVDSFTPTSMPVPAKPTRFYCILDNGLHVVRTATASLRQDGSSKIGQEFELIQHKNLEFSLTLVAQRDAHLHEPENKQQSSPSASSRRERLTPSFSRGVGKLFSSPKKKLALSNSTSTMDGRGPAVEPMIAFLNREGAFGQCNVVFEKIAQDCLAKCHVLELPVHGVSDPPISSLSSATSHLDRHEFSRKLGTVRGVLRLKVFYLPPLVGIAKNLLPDNLNDCVKGMETARWHMGQPWKEGTLTQMGGDCRSWRRRPMKLQGANLVCYNEITKKATVKIDLTKATAVEENVNPVDRNDDEFDETYHVERSFRVTFKDGERIMFFADTDAEMKDWMAAMRKIVGNSQIPQPSLWAQMVLELIQSTQTAKQQGLLSSPSKTAPAGNATSQPMSAAPSSSGASTASMSSMNKRVPAPPTSTSTSDKDASTSTPGRNHQITQSRSRPLSMAVPQLSAVREVSTPEDTPTKAAAEQKPTGPSTPLKEAPAPKPVEPTPSPQKAAAPPVVSSRPRPQSMYGMPPGPLAARPGAPAASSTPMRIQHSMQNGSPVRKLPIPSGAAVAAISSAPATSRPLHATTPAPTTTSPKKAVPSTPVRSTRPLPPPASATAERPLSVYHDRRA